MNKNFFSSREAVFFVAVVCLTITALSVLVLDSREPIALASTMSAPSQETSVTDAYIELPANAPYVCIGHIVADGFILYDHLDWGAKVTILVVKGGTPRIKFSEKNDIWCEEGMTLPEARFRAFASGNYQSVSVWVYTEDGRCTRRE